MKADPIASSGMDHTVSVRRPSQLKDKIKRALSRKKLNLAGISRTLTYINLKEILNNPCLLLVLTMDIVHDTKADEPDKLYLRLEDDRLPVSHLLPVKDIVRLFYTGIIDTLILCGSNTTKLLNLILANSEKRSLPTMIIFDTAIEDPDIDIAQ
jgi:hypothetical protein